MEQHLEYRFDCVVALPRTAAFALFVDKPELWWLSPFADSAGQRVDAGIDPFAGGSCYQISPSGKQLVWGTVLSIEAPLYFRLAWQVSAEGAPIADPAAASRVMVNFRDAGENTRLELVHSEFLRHGEDGAAHRDHMAGPDGWPILLKSLAGAAIEA